MKVLIRTLESFLNDPRVSKIIKKPSNYFGFYPIEICFLESYRSDVSRWIGKEVKLQRDLDLENIWDIEKEIFEGDNILSWQVEEITEE